MLLVIQLPLIGQETKDYTPLTKSQADSWLKSITYDELISYVIKWDYIEHSKPVIIFPSMLYSLSGESLFISTNPLRSPISISIAGSLLYEIPVDTIEIKEFLPKKSFWEEWGSNFGFFSAGAVVLGVVWIITSVVK